MEKPCLVKINGVKVPAVLVAKDDFGMCSVRIAFDEVTPDQRKLLGWKGHNRECWKVAPESAVEVTG